MYKAIENGELGDNKSWAKNTLYNITEYQYKMLEYTASIDTMFDYGAPFQSIVKSRWPKASFSIFNVYQLVADICDDPTQYLYAPANITGPHNTCNVDYTGCVNASEPASSFTWCDELHPSEKTSERTQPRHETFEKRFA